MTTYYTSRFSASNWSAWKANLSDEQYSEKLAELYRLRREMQTELDTLLAQVTERAVAGWTEAGGCSKCLGWGTVTTWASLDYRGCADFGECPDCDGNSNNKQPGSKYEGWFQYALPSVLSIDAFVNNPYLGTELERALVSTYEIHIAELSRDIDDETENCIVDKGKTVVVFKGRKVPRGTTGVVIWIGDNGYGKRVGVKDATDVVHWTAIDNVKVAA